jgi:hypothetical protein
MKMFLNSLGVNVPATLILICVILFSGMASAQNKKGDIPNKTVKIKVIKEKDGKKSVLDTTITGDGTLKDKDIDAMMAELEKDMKLLESDLKTIDMDVSVTLSDSGNIDSLKSEIRKVIIRGNDCCKGRAEIDCLPHGYKFDFEDIPGYFQGDGFEGNWGEADGNHFYFRSPGPDFGIMDPEGKNGGTLGDLLGDIPMERVKQYSVKDTKHGKKITIEVENGPMFGSRSQTIIIKDPSSKKSKKYRHEQPEHDVQVIIKSDKENNNEQKTPESERPVEKM